MLYEAGAKEIHLRIACPPIKYPDYYGVDTPEKKQLLAANHSVKEMCKLINVTTLGFLSIDGMYKAMGCEKRNPIFPQFTDHYFTGDFPIKPIDYLNKKTKNNQLSLLSNTSNL